MVWKDQLEKRYFWAPLGREPEKLLYELVKAEEEEDTGIYLLMMHYHHAKDRIPFSLKERKKILKNLSTLIQDTKKHQKLLHAAIERLQKESRP